MFSKGGGTENILRNFGGAFNRYNGERNVNVNQNDNNWNDNWWFAVRNFLCFSPTKA